jgi:glycosyltransferase involved in cell wall biosynthesis
VDLLRDEPVRLLVVGSGPQEELLRDVASERHLEHRITFFGHVEESEKFRILQISDVYVSTSQHEGFGLVYLEAMASGLPIVCYDHGGQTDFLEHGSTGYVLKLNDLNGFALSCHALIRDPVLRQHMGQENIRRVNDLFIERCAERYEVIFQEAITACRLQGLVNLSTIKKLPLAMADTRLIGLGAGNGVASLVSLARGQSENEALGQASVT